MNHWDRLQGQLRSDAPDCLPIALWRHWPEHDQEPRALAMATMRWQRRYDFDLVRHMPSNTCAAEYWGARSTYSPNAYGLRSIEQRVVTAPDQWLQLRPSAAHASRLSECNEGLAQVAEALGGTVPLIQTVTSPLAIARQLAGDAVFEHMRQAPDSLEAGLRAIAQTAASFASRAIEAGACGVALVVDAPVGHLLSADEFTRFGRTFDLQILTAICDTAQLNMVHVDGGSALFGALVDYPSEILNWSDRVDGPDLLSGASRFSGIAAGGLDAAGCLGCGSRAEVDQAVLEVSAAMEGRRAMIAAGGPCMLDTPEANIDGVVDAVRRRARSSKEASKP